MVKSGQSLSELFPLESVQLGWNDRNEWNVGSGLLNLGNTCYLNSVLQAIFHVPAVVNWLTSREEHAHAATCPDSVGGPSCVICAVRETLEESQRMSGNSIRPLRITDILTHLGREFVPGRQQDAHEFLRCLIEKMREAYLKRFENLRSSTEIDRRVLETTPLDQIFGGYLSSSVTCGNCSHVSETKQHFMDLALDIERTETVDQALDDFFAVEDLDMYRCGKCGRSVGATKQFAFERPPQVLCLHLKRFSYFTNDKITKHVRFRRSLVLSKYNAKQSSKVVSPPSFVYKLVGLMSHHGSSNGRGHYTAVCQTPSGTYHRFDDHLVTQISYNDVSQSDAYVMFYELDTQRPNLEEKSKPQVQFPNNGGNRKPTPAAAVWQPPPVPVGLTEAWNPKPKSKKKKRRNRGQNSVQAISQ